MDKEYLHDGVIAAVSGIAESGINARSDPLSVAVLAVPYRQTAVAARLADKIAAVVHYLDNRPFHQPRYGDNTLIFGTHRVGVGIERLLRQTLFAFGSITLVRH